MRLEESPKYLSIIFFSLLILRVAFIGYEFIVANLLPMPKISSNTNVFALFGDVMGDRPGPQTIERIAIAEAIARESSFKPVTLVGGNRGKPGAACAFLNQQSTRTKSIKCSGQSYSTRSNLREIRSDNHFDNSSTFVLITSKTHSYRVRYLCRQLQMQCSVHVVERSLPTQIFLRNWVHEITAMTAEVLLGSYADKIVAYIRLHSQA